MAARDIITSKPGEPTWEIAQLFPIQGEWDEQEYLTLETIHLVEYSDGELEVLPMPSVRHQRIVLCLYRLLYVYVAAGHFYEVLLAPLPVQLRVRKYREPDIVVLNGEKRLAAGDHYVVQSDLVVEVVSPGNPDRDYVQKRREYAEAGIAEYWIVDPIRELITVLALQNDVYAVHGEFTPRMQALSKLLDGFTIDVSEVFAAAG